MSKKTFFIASDTAEYTDNELSFVQTEFMSEGRLNHENSNNDLSVTPTSPASMSLLVLPGMCIIEIEKNGETFKTINYSSTTETIQCPTNNTGITRYDTIIGRVDVETNPNELKSDVFTIERLEGTSNGIPTNAILSDDDITTIVGSDGWTRLSDVTIASGTTSLTATNISNTANPVEVGIDSNGYRTIFRGDGSELNGVIVERQKNDLAGKKFDFNNDYQDSYKILASFQTDETWTDGVADTTNYLAGLQSIKISPSSGEVTSYYTVSLDMTEFTDGEESNLEDDIQLVFYVDTLTNLTQVGVRFYTSTGNYYEFDEFASITAIGYQYLTFPKSGATTIGNPSWSNITKVEVFATASSAVNVSFNALNMVRNSGQTSRIYDRRTSATNTTATDGSVLTLGENDRNTRLAGKDYTGSYLRINNSVSTGYGQEYLILSNTDGTITVDGTLPTIASNVDWEIWGEDFGESTSAFYCFTNNDGVITYSDLRKSQTTPTLNILNKDLQDCSVSVLYQKLQTVTDNINGIVFRYQDVNNYYFISQDGNNIYLYKKVSGNESLVESSVLSTTYATDIYLKVKVEGNNIQIFSSSDGQTWTKQIEVVDMLFANGKIGLRHSGLNVNVHYKNIMIFGTAVADIAEVAMQLHPDTNITNAQALTDTTGLSGEASAALDLLAFGDYNAGDELLDLDVVDTDITIGYAADQLVVAFVVKLTTEGAAEYIKLQLKKTGTPDEPLMIQVYPVDPLNNNQPDWDVNLGGCYRILPANLTTSLVEYELPLSNFVNRTTSQQIWVTMWTKQAADTGDYYSVGVASSNTNANASYYKGAAVGGGSFAQISANDPYIKIGTYAEHNRLFKLDISKPHRSLRVAGINTATTSGVGEQVRYTKAKGKIGGFTNLTEGARYFASSTPGAITTTEPTIGPWIYVGEAISETELYFDPQVCLKDDDNNGSVTFCNSTTQVNYSFFTGIKPLNGTIITRAEKGGVSVGSFGVFKGNTAFAMGTDYVGSEYIPTTSPSYLGYGNHLGDVYTISLEEKTIRGITLGCLHHDTDTQTYLPKIDMEL
ncbi:MAG: hypothetical protein WC648_04095 [Candidatus Paceibacterota bacterium]|jgi:hypothetical protein